MIVENLNGTIYTYDGGTGRCKRGVKSIAESIFRERIARDAGAIEVQEQSSVIYIYQLIEQKL